MDRLEAMRVYVCIVERGSMVAAADHLGMSRSRVTRYLAELEGWAQARLLHRTTRRLSLTAAGEEVLQRCRAMLALAASMPQPADEAERPLAGRLRVSCGPFAAEHVLMPTLATFAGRYPGVSLEVLVTDELVDLVDRRIDLAIRIGESLDPNLIARRLGACPSVLVASPDYLARHGAPATAEDLRRHQCLIFSGFGRHDLWRFERDGEVLEAPVAGNLAATESPCLISAARLGLGISHQPAAAVLPAIERGELVQVLAEETLVPFHIWGVYASRERMPPALRRLLDCLVETQREAS